MGQLDGLQVTPVGGSAGAVVSAITYLPFGPMSSYTLGNGQTVTRTYDATHALTGIMSPALNLHFARDAKRRITAEGDTAGAMPANEIYHYDPLSRLVQVDDANGNPIRSYSYNKTGDRLTKAGGAAPGIYTYTIGTHKLSSVGSAARNSDANGNTTASGIVGSTYGYGYNDRNRMTIAQINGTTVGTYTYNALGQRIAKTATTPQATTERFAYDQAGHLIGEYGTTNRDYLWLGDTPVAVIDNAINGSVSASTINYVTADHLGTPRVVTNSVGAVIWEWSYLGNPFGDQLPTSAAGYVLNLRYAGQYFDAETNTAYNYFRTYDSATGRYLQSDPSGLEGGISSFGYVSNNPLLEIDHLGLQEEDIAEQSPYERELFKEVFHPNFAPPESRFDREIREGQCYAPGVVPKGGTYALNDPITEMIMRTGRSDELKRREGEHRRDVLLGDLTFTPVDRTDVYAEQRGLGQMLHDRYEPPLDRINPISPKNRNRASYMDAANNFNDRSGDP